MADTRLPSFLRVAGSSSPPAANPQVEPVIGVSDPYRQRRQSLTAVAGVMLRSIAAFLSLDGVYHLRTRGSRSGSRRSALIPRRRGRDLRAVRSSRLRRGDRRRRPGDLHLSEELVRLIARAIGSRRLFLHVPPAAAPTAPRLSVGSSAMSWCKDREAPRLVILL